MKKRGRAQKFLVIVILFLITSTSISISAFDFESQHSNTNETLIIGFEEEIPGWVFTKYEILDKNEELNCVLVKVREKVSIRDLTGVKYVERNKLVHALYLPNDSRFDEQWGLKCINVDKAWDLERGSKEITLAILDTGIDYEHEDLGNYAGGFDFVNNDSEPMDDNGHGTAVSGVAAATMDNGKGIAGVSQVTILALKVLNETGWGTDWNIAKAITFAVNQSADVIGMSFGGEDAEVMKEACSYAWDRGCMLVAASGNENASVIYPAAYSPVIAVGAINKEEERASYSNFGDELELVAPGDWILTTYPGDRYNYFSGTSFSTPYVCGVAALVKSKYPELTNEEIRNLLRNTAKDLGEEGKDVYYGYGKVDAYVAIQGARPGFDTGEGTYPSIFGTHNGTIKTNQTINVHKLYTYPCPGTGGHTEYVWIWNSSWEGVEAHWNGYLGDWHNISFNQSFMLIKNETYNYTIQTGSYPQIHHNKTLTVPDGEITCTNFTDANGRVYYDWIPAIKLFL